MADICDAESILIFGPGEAEGELMKRLEKTISAAASPVSKPRTR